jgi:hypothetical protein
MIGIHVNIVVGFFVLCGCVVSVMQGGEKKLESKDNFSSVLIQGGSKVGSDATAPHHVPKLDLSNLMTHYEYKKSPTQKRCSEHAWKGSTKCVVCGK